METITKIISIMTEDYTRKSQVSFIHIIVTNEDLVKLFKKLLIFTFSSPNQIKDCLVSTIDHEEIDTLSNQIKTFVLKCLNKLMDFMFH